MHLLLIFLKFCSGAMEKLVKKAPEMEGRAGRKPPACWGSCRTGVRAHARRAAGEITAAAAMVNAEIISVGEEIVTGALRARQRGETLTEMYIMQNKFRAISAPKGF